MPIEDMDKTEQIIKWLFDESITTEEIDEMESMNVEWYKQPDVPDAGVVCNECGGMEISLSVMTSINPNGKDKEGQMKEMFDEAEYDELYCYSCDDNQAATDIKYIRGEEMIGSMVKRMGRNENGKVDQVGHPIGKGQTGLVVGVKQDKIREEDRHYVPEGYVAGHYEVMWAGETGNKKMYENNCAHHYSKIWWMNQTEEVA